jgi:hypothetical protein
MWGTSLRGASLVLWNSQSADFRLYTFNNEIL